MPEIVNTSALSVDGVADSFEQDDRPTMIKVDHVSMVFNMASEQLNSLKEYAIKIARRELFFEGFKALDDVSFEVKKGDVFGIMGTNGSGKSTMLKVIAGVLEPSEGKCTINGNIAPLIELGAGFDMELTARENIYLNGALLGYTKQFINEHFDEIVAFAEIEKFLDMPLKNYSSGMVARIAFAVATVIVPDILLVDEVLSVGDFMFQKKCEDRINELIEKHGVTVLIVSHSNEQVTRLCNKAVWIEKGHVRLLGDAKTVSRVYGGLGGRIGCREAELRVLEAIERSSVAVDLSELNECVTGDDAIGTNMKLVSSSFENRTVDTVAVACDSTHANAVVINPLASALNAPVLPVKPNSIPDLVENYLRKVNPRRILFADCGSSAECALRSLKSLLPNAEYAVFQGAKRGVFDFSKQVFRFGQNKGIWGDSFSLVHFDDNALSLAFSPYTCLTGSPVVMVNSDDYDEESILELIKDKSFKKVVLLGDRRTMFSEIAKCELETVSVGTSHTKDSFVEIAQLTWDLLRRDDSSGYSCLLYVGSGSPMKWPELISSGSCLAREGTCLLLLGHDRFESTQSCLDFIAARKNEISKLVFIGGHSSMSDLEMEFMTGELL